MITHFREPKYRQPMGTDEGLTGGLGGGHFSVPPTFLHNLGSTRRTSMTDLSHHYSSKGQGWANVLNGNAIPAGYQGCISWAAFLVPPHTPTVPSCAGAAPGQGQVHRYPPEAWDKAAEEEESVSLDEGGEECKGSIDCKWYDEALLSSQLVSEAAQQDSPHHHS